MKNGTLINPLTAEHYLMKFSLFASVDIRPLPGTLVAELLGIVLGVQDHKNIKFLMTTIVAIDS